MFWLKCCPRCEGDLYEENDTYGRYIACLQCGRVINPLIESGADATTAAASTKEIRGIALKGGLGSGPSPEMNTETDGKARIIRKEGKKMHTRKLNKLFLQAAPLILAVLALALMTVSQGTAQASYFAKKGPPAATATAGAPTTTDKITPHAQAG